MAAGEVSFCGLVLEAGIQCPRCGSGRCAKRHSRWYRKRVQDLSTGEVFEQVPILRAAFCDGSTASLFPAELWRGRSTLSSVLETVFRVHRDGIERAHEWTSFAGTGESVVSRRTLWRWRDLVLRRLVGSAWAWLESPLGLSWSDRQDVAAQLYQVLDRLAEPLRLTFRAATGRAVLDKPTPASVSPPSATRRVAGRLVPSPSHDSSSPLRPRGSWCTRRRGRSPPPGRHGGRRHD